MYTLFCRRLILKRVDDIELEINPESSAGQAIPKQLVPKNFGKYGACSEVFRGQVIVDNFIVYNLRVTCCKLPVAGCEFLRPATCNLQLFNIDNNSRPQTSGLLLF